MRISKRTTTLIFTVLFIVLGPVAGVLANYGNGPTERHIIIKARQFGYDPSVIKVNKGDKVTIEVITEDVTHGFYLDGYNINLEARPAGDPAVVTFIADKTGKFNFRCSQTCGVFHPFMIGKLIVEPNNTFPGAIGLAIGIGIGSIFYFSRKEGGLSGKKS